MPLFRRRPTVVEAVKFDGSPEQAQALMRDHDDLTPEFGDHDTNLVRDWSGRLILSSAQGRFVVHAGDYVVTEPGGFRHVVKPEKFEAQYEPRDLDVSPNG